MKKLKKIAKTIMIQPAEKVNGVLPYPYFINKNGLIGRQNFWRGNPYKLLGFSIKPIAGNIELEFKDFWKKPKLAEGMYAVFTDNKDNWTTLKDEIDYINYPKTNYSSWEGK